MITLNINLAIISLFNQIRKNLFVILKYMKLKKYVNRTK